MRNDIDEKLLITSSHYIDQEEYWANTLSGDMTLTEMPVNIRESGNVSLNLEKRKIVFSQHLPGKIMTLSNQNDLAIYMVLLTALNALIYRYTGNKDIVVLSPTYKANESEDTLNHYVLIRRQLHGELTAKELLLNLKQSVLDAYDNQDYPFDSLLDYLVESQRIPQRKLTDIQCLLTNIHGTEITTSLDNRLVFSFQRKDEQLDGTLYFDSYTFGNDYSRQIANHFSVILESALENMEHSVRQLEFLSPAEKENLLTGFNGPHQDYPQQQTLHQVFQQQVKKSPDHVAVLYKDWQLTYAQLDQDADGLAAVLKTNGSRPGSIVGIKAARLPEMITAIFAVLKAGCVYLPIDERWPRERILYTLADSAMSVLLQTGETDIQLGADFPVIDLLADPGYLACHISPAQHLHTPDKNPAYIIYTSGSTGKPKGVIIEHRHILDYIYTFTDLFRLDSSDIVLQQASIAFDLSCEEIFPGLLKGGKIIIVGLEDTVDAERLRRRIQKEQITLISVSPPLLNELNRIAHDRMPSLRVIVSGGDLLTYNHIDRLIKKYAVYNSYGPTEATVCVSFHRCSPQDIDDIPIGTPLANTRVFILDRNDNLLPPEVPGQLCVSGKEIARGYLNKVELTQEKFAPHLLSGGRPFYRTGDLTCWTPDGRIRFLGRIDSQVKIRGFRIELGEIENLLLQKEEINEAAVIVIDGKNDDKSLCAYVAANSPLSQWEIRQYVSERLPDYMIPRFFMFLEQLPRTTTGKLDRKALPQPAAESHQMPFITGEILEKIALDLPAAVSKKIPVTPGLQTSPQLSEEEKNRIIHQFNDTRQEYPINKTVHRWFEEQVVKTPTHIALEYRGATLTYDNLNRKANRLAHLLRSKGVLRDRLVAICVEPSFHLVTGILAILKSGAACLPLETGYPPERKRYMIEDCAATIILVNESSGVLEAYLPHRVDAVDIAAGPQQDCSEEKLSSTDNSHGTDLFYAIYTSGSTGKPKGTLLDHRIFVNLFNYQYTSTNLDFNRVMQFSPIGFDASFQEIFSPLLCGGRLYLIDNNLKQNVLALLEFIEKNEITTLFSTPSFLKSLFNEKDFRDLFPGTLKHIQVAGEEAILTDNFKNYLKKNNIYLHNHYGPSETHVVTTLTLPPTGDLPDRPGIGAPIANTSIYIMGERHLQPIGVQGELFIAGHSLARGYLNQVEMTHEKFVPNPFASGERMYRSGDSAAWLTEGAIRFFGRIDSQVQLGGIRVEPGELECLLLNHHQIKEAAILLKENKKEEKYLAAYVVANGNPSERELISYLSNHLPGYMLPTRFVQLEYMPLTSSRKINKKLLAALEIPSMSREDGQLPANPVEETMVGIMAELLERDKNSINMDDNFFELGGHSLKAIMLISRIHKEFDVKISMVEIFKSPQIRSLAKYITSLKKEIFTGIPAAEKKEYYQISPAQNRLYILYRMGFGDTAYNVPIVVELEGKPEVDQVEGAFRKMIARYESLRTSVNMMDKTPVQKVLHPSEVEFDIEYHELGSENDGQTVQEIIAHFIRPFELSRAPLLRAGLVKMETMDGIPRHVLMVDMHHILTDMVSQSLLVTSFISFYNDLQLPGMRLQYKDYSEWRQRPEIIESLKQQEEFWLKEFEGEIPVLNLPTDHPRPVIQSFEGNLISFEISAGEKKALNEMAQSEGATLFMVLLATFNILLTKLSNQEEIVVGTPVIGRWHADLEQIVGIFLNMLALKNAPRGELTFNGFLKQLKEKTLVAYENQNCQFETLVEKVAVHRDTSRNPLFDVTFMFQNMFGTPGDIPEREMQDLKLKPYHFENKTSKYDLTLMGYEAGEKLYCGFEYSSRLFERETITRIINYFKHIISSITVDPHQEISRIDIVPPDERKRLLEDFNNTQTAYPKDKTLHRLFQHQEGKTPHALALVFKDHFLTYNKLDKESNRLANYLLDAINIQLEERVGILMNRSFNIIIAILGILKAGAAYVPIDSSLPEARIKFIIDGAEIGAVISEKEHIKVLNRLQWDCKTFHTFLCLDSTSVHDEEETEENRLMDREMWHLIGQSAHDGITGGGWYSGYTGEPFSKEEMQEYSDNIFDKVIPLLNKNSRVLEIGCASGLSMYRIAPRVGFYLGTDLSQVISENNKKLVKEGGHQNIFLSCLPAHEIDKLEEENFDMVILNSVIQYFQGHNYLRRVLRKAIDKLGPKGYLFLGDLMDLDLKDKLIGEMKDFKRANSDKNYRTKTNWSAELFISRAFLEDFVLETPGITGTEFSRKIHTLENELTKFRYDALIKIDKTKPQADKKKIGIRRKNQHDRKTLEVFGTETANPGENRTSHADNLVYVTYTSGTTGVPKGIMIQHRAVSNFIKGITEIVDFKENDYVLSLTTISFDIFFLEAIVPITRGARVVIGSSDEQVNNIVLIDALLKRKITIFQVTPSRLQLLFSDEVSPAVLDKLKYLLVGGEAFPEALLKKARELVSGKIYNLYGPTETTIWSTAKDVTGENPLNIGKPIANTQIYILGERETLLPLGVAGELCIGGDGLARGYLNNDKLTSEKFIENPFIQGQRIYRTGDQARWLDDGNIEFLGRIDNQVKLRGFRIEPGEIEALLQTHESIKEAAVVAYKNEEGDTFLCAYFVPRLPDNNVHHADLTQELRDFLAMNLPNYMIPSYFVRIETMPLTASGKIDRKTLLEIQLPGSGQALEDLVPPANDVEEKLALLWAGVLGREKEEISMTGNFFQDGGHSLKAMILISQIHRELNVKIPLMEFFKTPSVRALASYVENLSPDIYKPIETAPQKEYYELSSAQKRLFILHQMIKDDIAYNECQVLLLEGTPDGKAFERTFRALILRHDSLRTGFHLVAGEPRQKIEVEVPFEIEYFEMPQETEYSPQTPPAVDAVIDAFIRPFDLASPPLLRVGLIKIHTGKYILMLDTHHIITDGVSQQILVKDFISLYRGAALPPLAVQYKDFAEWQNSAKGRDQLNTQEKYWLDKFSGEIPVLELPVDYPRPSVQNFEGNTLHFSVTRETAHAFKRLALAEHTTSFMVLTALYSLLIARLSGAPEIVMGTLVAGRRHADLEPVIGMFVNTLALRIKSAGKRTFREFLQELKITCTEAFENQDYQFEDLVDKVALRNAGRNPIFDVMFTLNTSDPAIQRLAEEKIQGLKFQYYPYIRKVSRFDLIFIGYEYVEELSFNFEYSTKLFKEETVKRFISYFRRLMESIIANPGQSLADLEIMPTEEREQVLYEFNRTAEPGWQPSKKTIHELFFQQVELTPDNDAIVDTRGTLSYRQLIHRANQVAGILKEKGIGRQDIVALLGDSSAAMISGILGILKAGGVYLPLDTVYPEGRIAAILKDSGSRLLLTEENTLKKMSLRMLQENPERTVTPIVTPPRPPVKDLSKLPMVDRGLVDYTKYNAFIGNAMVKNALPINDSRGCPYSCAYCFRVWPKTYAFRSAENLFQEISRYYDLGIHRFNFIDDAFNLDRKNSGKFFEMLIRENLDVQLFFPSGLRGDRLNKDYIDLLVEAGTVNLALALETASPRLQKLINKNLNLDKFYDTVDYIVNKHPQVILELFTMNGLPTETEEEAMMTLDFIKNYQWIHFPYVLITKIYPNTDMYRIALQSGISREQIERSAHLGFSQLPETLPFSKSFTLEYQARYLNEYILNKERLKAVIPFQRNVMSKDEMLQKYNSFLPFKKRSFAELLDFFDIHPDSLPQDTCIDEEYTKLSPIFIQHAAKAAAVRDSDDNACRILLLDMNLNFSHCADDVLYDVVEVPLGLMYILTYLKEKLGSRVTGKIAKSRMDFDNYEELMKLVEDFKPDVIGIGCLTFYRDLFHKTLSVLRNWGVTVPIIAGGPYATSSYSTLLADTHVDIAVLGEGEVTFTEIIEKIIANHKKLPPASELKQIPGIAFVEKENKSFIRNSSREILLLDHLHASPIKVESPGNINESSDLAYIIYTSGSTGMPRGVLAEHKSVVNVAYWFKDTYNLIENKRVLQSARLTFDVSVEEIFATLLSGGTLYIPSRETFLDPRRFTRYLEENAIAVCQFVPATLKDMLLPYKKIASLKVVICGGDVLEMELKNQALRAGYTLYNHYGPTEVTVDATAGMCNETQNTIGKPISNARIYILDSGHRLQPIGVVGELYVGGTGVARGYLNRPQLTSSKFIPNPFAPPGVDDILYRTGDLARWLPNGEIENFGRIDYQVKIRGLRIELGEIENSLRTLPYIDDVVVVALEERNRDYFSGLDTPGITQPMKSDKYLCAYLVASKPVDLTTVREFLANRLPEYMIPSYFVLLEKILLTASGKVDRKALIHYRGALLKVETAEAAPPENDIEKTISEVWKEVLELDHVGIHTNFFEAGGNSLDIIKLNAKFKVCFKREINVVKMFEYPTIHSFALYLKEELAIQAPDTEPQIKFRTEQIKKGKADRKKRHQLKKGEGK